MKRSWIVALVPGAVALGLWWRAPPPARALLVNRIWVERQPTSAKDMVLDLMLLEREEQRAGAVLVASEFRMLIEMLDFEVTGETLRMVFPQEDTTTTVTWRAWECAGTAPKPFELCLELKAGRRVLKLYSMEDWVIDDDQAGLPAGLPTLELHERWGCPTCVPGLPRAWAEHGGWDTSTAPD